MKLSEYSISAGVRNDDPSTPTVDNFRKLRALLSSRKKGQACPDLDIR